MTLHVAESDQIKRLAVHGAATSGMRGVIVHQVEWVSGIALRVLHQYDRLQAVGPPRLGDKQSGESFGGDGAEIVKGLGAEGVDEPFSVGDGVVEFR